MGWDRKEHTWTSEEFALAMGKLGLCVSPGAMAVHIVFGNGMVKLKWSDPETEPVPKAEPESVETESPESTSGSYSVEEGADDGADE